MASVKCYFIQETSKAKSYLRRYCPPSSELCESSYGYHNAAVLFNETSIEIVSKYREVGTRTFLDEGDEPDELDSRWPTRCDYCGHEFSSTDPFQMFHEVLYVCPNSGKLKPLREWEPGAIWEAWWAPHWMKGFDGKSYFCRLPDGHDWCIDGRASNCTRPDDPSHRCWLRHGEAPNFTVNKEPSHLTCQAGGGSIQSKDYHGFLTEGNLTHC